MAGRARWVSHSLPNRWSEYGQRAWPIRKGEYTKSILYGVDSVNERSIYITEYDLVRLRDQVDDARRTARGGTEHLDDLIAELDRARIVAPTEVPPDVVTMNSKVSVVDLDLDEEMVFTLVFHKDADIAQSKISVLAPIGTAVLGYRVGDTFSWVVPDGIRHLKIREVLYQPEAEGNFEL